MVTTRLLMGLGLGLLPYTLADTFDVDVGKSGFVFSPDTVKASVGDTINFHFYPGDHSVAQSTFSSPCQSSGSNAIYSGFINPSGSDEASTMFSVPVNTTDPIWLYCAQIQHCQAGMAMVINPPSSGNTLAAYKQAASSASTIAPAHVFGGVFEPNKDSGDSGDNSSSAMSSVMASTVASTTAATATASTTSAAATSGGGSGGANGNGAVAERVGWKILSVFVVPVIAWLLK